MDPTAVTIRPRFVWGRRPRANGGRRRPRGREGFYKYPAVVSCGSYPISTKHIPAAPRLEEFPLVAVNQAPPAGDPALDAELERVSLMYGGVARIRHLLLARAELMMTLGVFLTETKLYWSQHDQLLKTALATRMKVMTAYGVEVPAPPEHFFNKF